MKLTLEQRARRAATRRNNKIRKRYPLFAEHFATTPEREAERLRRQDEAIDRYFTRLRAGRQAAYERGLWLRETARELLPADVWQERDAVYQSIYGHRPHDLQGHELSDWWWCLLRDYASDWAHAHCPIRHQHAAYHAAGLRCPVCHLTPRAADLPPASR